MNKKGQVTVYIIGIIAMLFIIVLAGFFAPIGVDFNSKIYLEGEKLLLSANDSISAIENVQVRDQLLETVGSAQSATQDNIEINAAFFRYGWVIALVLVGLIIFLFTRQLSEFRGGFA